MTQRSVDSLEFLAELGADMSVQAAGHGSPVDRAHRPKEGAAGANITNPMIAEIERLEIPVYLETPGTQLIAHDGVVIGAKAESLDGRKEYSISAKAVIIATGNFASNNEMIAASKG